MLYSKYHTTLMAQWRALAAHGQWIVGSNHIRVIGGVRKGHPTTIAPVLQIQKTVPGPHSEKKPNSAFLTGYGDFKQT